jgi:hypothetical protein
LQWTDKRGRESFQGDKRGHSTFFTICPLQFSL